MCTANFFFEKGICEMKTEKERGGLAIFFFLIQLKPCLILVRVA
jgi:hypothetical protein